MRAYFGDLGHYTTVLTNNFVPLNVGNISAFLKSNLKQDLGVDLDVKIFKDPRVLIKAIQTNPPEMLGLSNYCWNQAVSEAIFKLFKQVNPNGLTLWGGPNGPINEPKKLQRYLQVRPDVDFYVPYEGELPAYNIVKHWVSTGKSIAELKRDSAEAFEGSHFILPTGELAARNIGLKLPDLNLIPSPYLMGLMDEFLAEGIQPLMETSRGCPYTCQFCHEGLAFYNKIRFFDLERLKKEIWYIVEHTPDISKSYIEFADSNMGMYPQDQVFFKFMREVYDQTGWPNNLGVTTGKGRTEHVIDTVKMHPKMMVSMAVQSMDQGVLTEVKRTNPPLEKMKAAQLELDMAGRISTPEIILGLPHDSKKAHLETIRTLIKKVQPTMIQQYTFMLLPGTSLYTDAAREKYKYISKFRLLPSGFGDYDTGKCFEIEEVAVGTKDLTHEEYLEMREMFFLTYNIYSNPIYRSMIRYLVYIGEDIVTFFQEVSRQRLGMPKESFPYRVIAEYIAESAGELFETEEELRQFYSEQKNYNELLEGQRGRNLTHTYKAMVLVHSDEWAEFVLKVFEDYVAGKRELTPEVKKMLVSIRKDVQSQAQCQASMFGEKSNLPTQESPIELELDYDVPEIFAKVIDPDNAPELREARSKYKIYIRPDAMEFIQNLPAKKETAKLTHVLLRGDWSYVFPVQEKSA